MNFVAGDVFIALLNDKIYYFTEMGMMLNEKGKRERAREKINTNPVDDRLLCDPMNHRFSRPETSFCRGFFLLMK